MPRSREICDLNQFDDLLQKSDDEDDDLLTQPVDLSSRPKLPSSPPDLVSSQEENRNLADASHKEGKEETKEELEARGKTPCWQDGVSSPLRRLE